jgi:Protein of unknown function (DUF3309)
MHPMNDGLSIPRAEAGFLRANSTSKNRLAFKSSAFTTSHQARQPGVRPMSLGLILIIILVIFLLGGFSGRFGGYGYGYGHGGIGIVGIILVILVVLLLMGRL